MPSILQQRYVGLLRNVSDGGVGLIHNVVRPEEPRFGRIWTISRITADVIVSADVVRFDCTIYLNGQQIFRQLEAPGGDARQRTFTYAPNGPIVYRPGDNLFIDALVVNSSPGFSLAQFTNDVTLTGSQT